MERLLLTVNTKAVVFVQHSLSAIFSIQKKNKKQNIPLYSQSCDSVASFSHSRTRSAASESHAPILQFSSSVSVYFVHFLTAGFSLSFTLSFATTFRSSSDCQCVSVHVLPYCFTVQNCTTLFSLPIIQNQKRIATDRIFWSAHWNDAERCSLCPVCLA